MLIYIFLQFPDTSLLSLVVMVGTLVRLALSPRRIPPHRFDLVAPEVPDRLRCPPSLSPQPPPTSRLFVQTLLLPFF